MYLFLFNQLNLKGVKMLTFVIGLFKIACDRHNVKLLCLHCPDIRKIISVYRSVFTFTFTRSARGRCVSNLAFWDLSE